MTPSRNFPAGIGFLTGIVAVVSYFAFITPVVSPHLPWLRDTPVLNLALLAVGLALSMIGAARALGARPTHRGRRLAPILAALNLGFAAFFGWYVFSLSSNLPHAEGAPQVGSVAPPLNLKDQRGETVSLEALRGRNTLLVFYRGYW